MSARMEGMIENLTSGARYLLSEHAEELEELDRLCLIRLKSDARDICEHFAAERANGPSKANEDIGK